MKRVEAIERDATELVSEIRTVNTRRKCVLRSVVANSEELPVVYAHHQAVAARVRELLDGAVSPPYEYPPDG